MSSRVAKTSKYTYSSSGGGNADVSIEYSSDLSALTRLEVGLFSQILWKIIRKIPNRTYVTKYEFNGWIQKLKVKMCEKKITLSIKCYPRQKYF